jgi:type I restriction enzyme S subunit
MNKGWREVMLGEVLRWRAPDTEVAASESYDFAGAYSHGRGIFRKHRVSGSSIAYDRLTRLRQDEFVYPKLMAWEGALGVVPPHCDGCFVSPEFQVFQIDSTTIHPRFFDFYMRRPRIWSDLGRLSPGTNLRRRRLNAPEFLRYRISMPPLAEQQRIVAHLDAIETRVTCAQRLREEEQKEKLALVTSLAHRWDLNKESKRARGWQKIPLGDVLQQTSEIATVDSAASYPNIGIYSYGRGTFTKRPIDGANTSATQLLRVRAGQFIYSRLFAFEGAYALVLSSQDGHYVSNEFPSFNLDTQRILPEFLFAYFKSPTVWTALADQSTGLGNRRQRVHPEVVLAHSIDLPPVEYQVKVRDALINLETLGDSATEAEIDALLPWMLDHIFQ